jgi:hypothetical protein
MTRALSDSFFESISSQMPTLLPQNFAALSDVAFKVESTCFGVRPSDISLEVLEKIHTSAYGEQFSVIPESINVYSDDFSALSTRERPMRVVSILQANQRSVEYNEANLRGFKVVSANIFHDQEGTIWRVVGNKNKRLVQTIRENFADLIKSRITANKNTVIASVVNAGIPVQPTEGGDFVLFYNTESQSLDTGLIFHTSAGKEVFSYSQKQFVPVSDHCIVSSVMNTDVFKELKAFDESSVDDFDFNTAQFTPSMRTNYQKYFSFLYNGTDFFDTFKKLLTMRQGVSRENLPLSTMI